MADLTAWACMTLVVALGLIAAPLVAGSGSDHTSGRGRIVTVVTPWLDNATAGDVGKPSGIPNGFPPRVDALRFHPVTLHSDIAYVRFRRDELGDDDKVLIWMQTDLCVGCKLLPVAKLTKKTKEQLLTAKIDTRFPTRIVVTTDELFYPHDNNTYCQLYYHFGLFGEYNLTIPNSFMNSSNVTQCTLVTLKEPIYANIAILVLYGGIFFLFFCAAVWFYCIKPRFHRNEPLRLNGALLSSNGKLDAELPINVQDVKKATSTRLRSVDAFRGLAILHLVLGASGDGQYWFLMHSRWYGITVADFMFPWFIFIMGTSIHLAFNIILSKGVPFKNIYKKLIFRSIALFVIGVCIQPQNDLRTLRIPGVLQRIGFSYFIVGSSYLFSRWLLSRRKSERTGALYMAFRDIIDYLELPLAACCLTVHLCLTFLLPVPGCPRGYQGPGGPLVGENGELTNCTGGAAGYIDRMFFTEAHMNPALTAQRIYHTTLRHDPEGILGALTSIALCAFGLQAGKIMHLFDTARGRMTRLVVWGLVLISCAAVLSKCHMADGWIPLNKNLWSVSLICLTGGCAFLVTALFHLLIDVTRFWNGAPLIYAGMNSILLYVGADILSGYLPFTWAPFVANHAEYVALGTWSMTLWLLIAYLCYKKKVFLKL